MDWRTGIGIEQLVNQIHVSILEPLIWNSLLYPPRNEVVEGILI